MCINIWHNVYWDGSNYDTNVIDYECGYYKNMREYNYEYDYSKTICNLLWLL